MNVGISISCCHVSQRRLQRAWLFVEGRTVLFEEEMLDVEKR
jgi:hypothetical protein